MRARHKRNSCVAPCGQSVLCQRDLALRSSCRGRASCSRREGQAVSVRSSESHSCILFREACAAEQTRLALAHTKGRTGASLVFGSCLVLESHYSGFGCFAQFSGRSWRDFNCLATFVRRHERRYGRNIVAVKPVLNCYTARVLGIVQDALLQMPLSSMAFADSVWKNAIFHIPTVQMHFL